MTLGTRVTLGLALPLALAAIIGACSKHDDESASDAGTGFDAGYDARVGVEDAPRDTRWDDLRESYADAGRFCGDGKEQPDCPMQSWMKRYATTMIGFGDITAISDVFEKIAKMAPEDYADDGRPYYPRWSEISLDGANAARAGDIPAAKAACRGCHAQYLRTYHALLRAKPVPPT